MRVVSHLATAKPLTASVVLSMLFREAYAPSVNMVTRWLSIQRRDVIEVSLGIEKMTRSQLPGRITIRTRTPPRPSRR
jgi:hypothetical protein